jgi:hypothetical protein
VSRAGAALAMVLVPAAADACATCISSPYGDQTYNWPYIFLILLPFVVASVIGGVMVRVSGVSTFALLRRLTRTGHIHGSPATGGPPNPLVAHQEETS